MSWTHSSKTVALGILLVVALGAAGTAAAVSFTADDPEAAEVGETVEFEVEMTDVFEDQGNQWTLEAETELENASWTIVAEDRGEEVERSSDRQIDLDFDDGVDTVIIEVQGTVPEMTEFDYDDPEEENYLVMELSEAGGGVLADGTWTAHRYTEDSQAARQAIDSANEAAEDADSDSARDRVNDAISLYNSGSFAEAINTAESAEEEAEGSAQTQQLLLFGGAAVVVLALLGGGYYLYQQRKQSTNKLQ